MPLGQQIMQLGVTGKSKWYHAIVYAISDRAGPETNTRKALPTLLLPPASSTASRASHLSSCLLSLLHIPPLTVCQHILSTETSSRKLFNELTLKCKLFIGFHLFSQQISPSIISGKVSEKYRNTAGICPFDKILKQP